MILVPEAVAFAFMAGLKPLVGLQAAWIMCLVAGLAGDRPAMISGATGAVAVVLPVITQVNLCTDCLVQRESAEPGFIGNPPACESPAFATPRRLGVMFYAVMLAGSPPVHLRHVQNKRFCLASAAILHDWLRKRARRHHLLRAVRALQALRSGSPTRSTARLPSTRIRPA